jgi:uncharacterized membrane protein YvbJ
MEVMLLIVVVFVIVSWLFKEDKSDIKKLKEALKDTDTDELSFLRELVENELKRRVDKKEAVNIDLNNL